MARWLAKKWRFTLRSVRWYLSNDFSGQSMDKITNSSLPNVRINLECSFIRTLLHSSKACVDYCRNVRTWDKTNVRSGKSLTTSTLFDTHVATRWRAPITRSVVVSFAKSTGNSSCHQLECQ
jgi:hypothetical protein